MACTLFCLSPAASGAGEDNHNISPAAITKVPSCPFLYLSYKMGRVVSRRWIAAVFLCETVRSLPIGQRFSGYHEAFTLFFRGGHGCCGELG